MKIFLSDTVSCITGSAVSNSLQNDRSVIFIVPEPAKAQVERLVARELLNTSGSVTISGKTRQIPVTSAYAGGDITSFIKLSDKILSACGLQGSAASAGNDIVLRNAIYSVLAEHRFEFKSFDKLTGRTDSINMLISLLGDFARYGIDPEEISKAINACSFRSGPYIDKLKDIKLLMEYLDELNAKYSLNLLSDPIRKAAEVLQGIDQVKIGQRRFRHLRSLLGHRYSVIQFGVTRNLTPGEYALITEIDRLSKGVDIYLNYSPSRPKAPFCKCADMVKARLDDGSNTVAFAGASTQSVDLAAISEGYAYSMPSGITDTDDIHLCEIAGTDNRIGYVFDEINRLTRTEGYKYKDIRIVCCDDDLMNRMHSVAVSYGLDVFIDRRISLNNTVVTRFVQTLLKLPLSNFELEDVLSVLRSGMLKVHPRYCDAFENYCVAHNITNGYRMFNENCYKTDLDNKHPMRIWIEDGTVPGMNEGMVLAGEFLYEYIVQRVLIPLRKTAIAIDNRSDIAGKAELLIDYLDGIRDYVIALRDELMGSDRSDGAESVVCAYDETMALLASFTHEMNKVDITQRNFLELFRTDMMNKTVGTIPLKVDSIEITTPEHAYYTPCRIMFIIGAQRDNFPHKRTSDGIMSAVELGVLASDISVELPDKIKAQSREEFITSALMLGAVSDAVYMIHEQGKGKSRIFDLLSLCVKEEKILINNYEIPIYGDSTSQRYKFDTARIDPVLMEELLKEGIKVSVTTIEQFMTCPVEFMLNKVLCIRERADNREIRSNGFGTLAHKLFEIGVKDACDQYKTPELLASYADRLDSDESLLNSVCEDILLKTIHEGKVAGSIEDDGSINIVFNNNQGNKLRRLFRFMYPKLIRECSTSRFIPSGYELEIGESPYLLKYKCGSNEFDFTGSVDRFDLSFDDAAKFRIQDYKTYSKGFKPEQLLAGVQIQLPAYANAVMNGRPGIKPKDFGYTLIAMDIDKKGKPLELKVQNAALTDEQMEIALRFADHVIEQAITEISEGRADALFNPAASDPQYHKMMGLVGNPTSRPVKQDIGVKKGDKAFEAMKEILDGPQDSESADGEEGGSNE
ncbi:MAG: PD-(D/E)XK nuclease family protein [Clostridiales bacterium]|nr:PD-(D/E)XK nuclease family protein [Clostridiales bacterium]